MIFLMAIAAVALFLFAILRLVDLCTEAEPRQGLIALYVALLTAAGFFVGGLAEQVLP